MKYHTPKSEDEVFPNLLGLTDLQKIGEEEYRGFVRANLFFESNLENIGPYNWELVSSIHHKALSHLYEFAGKLREVNISKGGFLFPAAKFLPAGIKEFEEEFLDTIPESIANYHQLIDCVAPMHAELLFIHPFREGNGRTARLFADLIALEKGFERFDFGKLKMPEYIAAVQAASDKNYSPMTELFRNLGP